MFELDNSIVSYPGLPVLRGLAVLTCILSFIESLYTIPPQEHAMITATLTTNLYRVQLNLHEQTQY